MVKLPCKAALASISHQTYILSSQGCGEVSMTHLPQSCPVSSALRLIENSGAHLTRPQQGPPAIWPHLHASTPAANEALWKRFALMRVSPATDSSYIADSGAIRAKALNCCLENLDSF
ncbi:hypothetical protein E1301_Tti020594 [Triplophysa tibetana]|uniref:Uncharacterized protein n=1 Tax=Triplophysa tibetana TaxID=1572043 RepID=A0A5A9NXV5_9TELE|nr:hypothetical protein E1301_Tti020594 [Triplophysa tibetana]